MQIDKLTSGLNNSRPMPKLFWPTALMPNLLAVRQSRNLFNFRQYKLFIDYIFHVLHTEVVFKIPVAKRKAEKLPYNFVYVPQAITPTLMAIAQNEIYQQIVNGLSQFV